jgi:N-formylglutamate amidohydrolase
VDDAKSNALTIVNLCGRPTATQLVEPCSGANSAAQDFKVVMQRVHTTFTPYKAKVQSEIDRQSALIRQIDAMNGQ